ncbi:hypothetical protein HRR83_002614 [Exophiala dermatitidis]|uniref:RING-type domain-containing protein n=2 Tax=Exophiala dermatitidis TaxID=5970 RepID=H6BZR4_EXODN|nr:uncharacterized protein HMPREF1120_05167 [Exophiala dermatitidis NIH/UT8656]KAJ4503528.1 hypothetical protein HRR74_009233 [Exophiala dermatitidis]EHY57118.1 hypothetical protein HMPREF1120_05167 [Exophiala dermatitidis NIH/UT8656]KAJ4514528.1 hypothetical protein HRR73_005556 [Exophiala dermatitidis]KAJ4531859.1 hypothetical protein HRR77_009130 [Exophiala dermatitidis]KAJ4537380.1 hypothetical protein HRR76_005390 [Exophiala dermatitidis]
MPGRGSLDGRWVFVITTLAIFLAILLLTMVIQRRQRTLLSLRIARGEVDLEALGIRRLSVPQDILDKLPKYTYTSKIEGAPATPGGAATRQVPFSQPACPICLGDFIHSETPIRELPCNHIFHPECIDLFLRNSSSLCPMCKKSALPPGYCPVNVTNLMVHRERLIRQQNHEETTSRIATAGATQGPVMILSSLSAPTAVIHNSRVHGHGAYNGDVEMTAVIGTDNQRTIHPAIAHYHSPNGGAVAATAESRMQPQAAGSNTEEVPAQT